MITIKQAEYSSQTVVYLKAMTRYSKKKAEDVKIMDNGRTRHTVKQLYDFIQSHLYFNRPDLQVNGERFNSTLLFALLTALTGGKALIIGEPGLGKTTAAEYVGSLVYQLPLGIVWASEVPGHPEQTEEKIPNLFFAQPQQSQHPQPIHVSG